MKKKKKIRNRNPTTANHRKSTTNHHKTTHKPTITAKPTPSKPRTNQKQTTQNPQIITIMSKTGSWRTSTSEREMVARA
jgi:hypothetical protein